MKVLSGLLPDCLSVCPGFTFCLCCPLILGRLFLERQKPRDNRTHDKRTLRQVRKYLIPQKFEYEYGLDHVGDIRCIESNESRLVPRRSLCADCTDWRTTFITSPHLQLSVNMQFPLVQSSHLAGFSSELTRISIGSAIPRWRGRMGFVASRSLYAVCTNWRTTFLTSPHPQLSPNMLFTLVQSPHREGFGVN